MVLPWEAASGGPGSADSPALTLIPTEARRVCKAGAGACGRSAALEDKAGLWATASTQGLLDLPSRPELGATSGGAGRQAAL